MTIFFQLILVIDGRGISCEIALVWFSVDLTERGNITMTS